MTTIIYNSGTDTINISDGITTISEITSIINNTSVIEQTNIKEYLLKSNIVIETSATLNITDNDTTYLKLLSNDVKIISIICFGLINIGNVEISSWNTTTNLPSILSPRSYIYSDGGTNYKTTTTINNSNIHHLGYSPGFESPREGFSLYRTGNNNILNSSFTYNENGLTLLADTNPWSCPNNLVDNCIFSNNRKYGYELYLNGSTQNTVSNCKINNNAQYGIYYQAASGGNYILNNELNGNNYQIHIYGSGTPQAVKNNKVIGGFPIWLENTGAITLQNNTLRNGIIGIKMTGGGVGSSSGNTIKNNFIINMLQDGINFGTGGSNIIESNTIYGSKLNGINIGTSGHYTGPNTIKNNIIVNSVEYGIKVVNNGESSKYNCLYNNTLGTYNGIVTDKTGDIYINPLFVDIILNDFHLKSTAGRWNGTTWINDTETSPIISMGDPTSDNSLSLWGGIIEIGAYGNTIESSNNTIIPSCPIPICNVNITQI